ncbi:hypothetical protein L917_02454 [Phytophthora nicotianae]|uniref:Uncharacterized protein n=1 Tax=Phytophthora nicotianae TaxID=4792 RepID=W2LW66_PHYNI|nr:hypothetical protein L917_02454 [Phytophthora nicotianae]
MGGIKLKISRLVESEARQFLPKAHHFIRHLRTCTSTTMSEALKALENASRRELQALAKELQLCRGNAKSDVILGNAMEFLDKHPKDGEQLVLAALGSRGNVTPVAKKATPKKETPKKKEKAANASVKVDTDVKDTKSKKQQPVEEPEEVESKTPEKKLTTKKAVPKENKKSKAASATATSKPTTASPAKSHKTNSKASPSTKKSPTSKTEPSSTENKKIAAKKEESVSSKKSALVSKKAEIKARKAVEALVKSVTDLTFVGDSRVRCSTTGHEMKADVDIINTYIHGKRYLKARNLKLSFAKYAPMFVDHPEESKPDMLWCNVTELAIARDEKSVKKHMVAPKYQKQLPIWKEEEVAKKKAEEEAQRRAARIEAAKKRRLEAAKEDGDAVENERPAKRKRTTPSK